MNVLFITYDFPYPTNSGGKNRAYHLLKYTAKKANVFLLSFVRDDYNPEHNDEILNLGVRDIKVFKRKKLKSLTNISPAIFSNNSIFKTLYYDAIFEEMILEYIKSEKIDLVHFESTYTGFYINEKIHKTGVKTVLGTENIEYQLYLDYLKFQKNIFKKPIVKIQAEKLKNEELFMVKNTDSFTTITNDEGELFKSLTDKNYSVVANGIEPSTYKYEFDKNLKNNILFVGNFSYFPNVDGIEFFYKEVFSKYKKDVTLTVIGKNGQKVIKKHDPRVIKKDFVPDIIEEYRNCDVLVFPIRIGGGTNFKVLEAMSLGTPILAQPERLAGLRCIDGEHFLGASNANEFMLGLNKLYEDRKFSENLTKNARGLINEYYSWEKIGEDLLTVWRKT